MILLSQVQEFDQLLYDHVMTHHKQWFVGSPRSSCVRFHIPHWHITVDRQSVYRSHAQDAHAHTHKYEFINWRLMHDQLLIEAEWRYDVNKKLINMGWQIYNPFEPPDVDLGPESCDHVGDVTVFESMLTELRLIT